MNWDKYLIVFFVSASLLNGSLVYCQSQNDTLQYRVDFDFSGRRISGVVSQLVAGGGVNVDLLYRNFHLENTTTYRYNKTNSRLIEDNWHDLVTLKYYLKGSKKFFPGLFYHFDNNLRYRVRSRHQYGLGIGSVLDNGHMKLSALAALAYENSLFEDADFVNSTFDFAKRKSGLFLLKLNNSYSLAKNKINFSYEVFYFQSLREKSDYDIWLSSRIVYKVAKSFSFFIIYDYRFENVYLEGLSNYNDIILFGIKLSLRSA